MFDVNDLINAALEVRQKAYAPYSGFRVGAALLTQSGQIFTGCNVENISLGLTICAERAAVAAAIANGDTRFVALAIATGSTTPSVPCGACRQVLAEFNPDLRIISATADAGREEFVLADLLPKPTQGILTPHSHV